MILGITGGIATGKSTVTEILAAEGVRVIDADELSHFLTRYDTSVLGSIREVFGPGVFHPAGALDRQALARIAFSDDASRRRLEKIIHPPIVAQIENNIAYSRSVSTPLVVSAPLLFEAGLDTLVEHCWVVSCTADRQISRILERPGMTEAGARARIAAQMPLREKESRAGTVIDNNGSIDDLRNNVLHAWHSIIKV